MSPRAWGSSLLLLLTVWSLILTAVIGAVFLAPAAVGVVGLAVVYGTGQA